MATCGGPVLRWRSRVGWAVVGVEVQRGRRHVVGSGVEAGDRQRCVVGHDPTWGGRVGYAGAGWMRGGGVGRDVWAESDMWGPVGCAVVESRHGSWLAGTGGRRQF